MSIVPISLAMADKFPDLTPIPERLWKAFGIEVFDDMALDGDWAVSEDIKRHGVWEPVETVILSSAFVGNPTGFFVDLGCHVGWYSILARQWGLPVLAIDNSQLCLDMLDRRNDDQLVTQRAWIDSDWNFSLLVGSRFPVIVKMDIEGNEQFAVKAMAPLFKAGAITHCLMEVSPVFNQSYPHIINNLVSYGYECWVLPEKQTPPPVFGEGRRFLEDECRGLHWMTEKQRRTWVNDQHQFNAVFCKEDSKWG